MPPDRDAPETNPPQTKTNAEAAKRRSKAFGTFLLATALSGILIALLAAYLIVAPDPITRQDMAPPVSDTTPSNVIRLVAPRSIIDMDLLRDFETETGAVIELSLYDDEETLAAVTGTSPLNADVLLASGTTIEWLRKQDRVGVLPARSIGNLGKIDPALRTLVSLYDQGGLHAVPFAWTSFGLGFNREAVAAQLGANTPIDTWGVLFDPGIAAKLSACGIHSVTVPSIAFPVALTFMELPVNSDAPADTERASALWEAVRGSMRKFDTRSVSEDLAGGQACVALASASDVYQARAAARNAGQSFTLEFVRPREGALLRLYMLALPRTAKNTARGAALIDYLLRPEVSARMTNSKWVANAVPGSQLYVRQEIKDDDSIYPDVGVFARLTPDANPSPATISLRQRFWLLMSTAPQTP